jgi:hypothetical protein
LFIQFSIIYIQYNNLNVIVHLYYDKSFFFDVAIHAKYTHKL